MTQEQKPKKKKISLMSVLSDPAKAVAELMDDNVHYKLKCSNNYTVYNFWLF